MSLKQAKKFLGNSFFKKALLTWSMPELFKTMQHPECFFSGADEAYDAVFRFRVFELGEGKKDV